MKHAFFRGLKAPLHISHRGGAALYPENTLYAFERAIDVHRTDVIELDVHATADGELVVFHDETLERCTNGRGPVNTYTFSELSRLDAAFHFSPSLRGQGIGIPRLIDVLRAFPDIRLNIEVKAAAAVTPFVNLVKTEVCLERVCIGSEHDGIAEELARQVPEACLFFPRRALVAFVTSAMQGVVQDDERYAVLDVPLEWEGTRIFNAQLAAFARSHHKWINVWTVDTENEMRECIADGVGGIMTDRPDILRSLLK